MLYTQKTLSTLEYDKIIAKLCEFAPTPGARSRAMALLPSDDYETVLLRQRRSADARRLLQFKGYPPFSGVDDSVIAAVDRAEKGATLTTRELLDIAALLRAARALLDYYHGNHPFDTTLDEFFTRLLAQRTLEDRITHTIVAEDMIADEATPALADIRRKIRSANNKIKDTLQAFVGGARSKYLQENIVTMRDGRYVVPVKSEYRNEIKGLLHDTSSSGATVFIEPLAVVEANNELRVLAGKEQQEIDRILWELSSFAAEVSTSIRVDYHQMTEIAFYFACAGLAESMRAAQPVITKERKIDLRRARHPLIDQEKVVPITLSLGEEYDTLIVTGPNTGGKTVTLKTLGLFALMAQAGLQIPAEEESEIGVFSEILVDIGDEQSIEQSLSTFSSHMVNIVDILGQIGERSLVLFDELGAGTDPVEGAALAVSILEHTRERGALTVSTTHYAELKAYALESEGVCNASCEFDITTLRPTYRLIVGTPGKSNAFAISERLGLDSSVIRRAETLVSGENKRFESVIEKLEESRLQMERDRDEAIRLRNESEERSRELERHAAEKLKKAEEELQKAQDKARQMLEGARASADFVFKQLDDLKKQQNKKNLSENLARAKREVQANLRNAYDAGDYSIDESIADEDYTLPRDLRVGDRVYLVSFKQEGVVAELPDKKGNVSVKAGILSAKVPIEKIRLLEGEPKKKKATPAATAHKTAPSQSLTFCKSEVDVRGMIGDDAWFVIDKYLDDAMRAGLEQVRIIHGKGTGALRLAVQRALKDDPRIRSFRGGLYGEGDSGVTVVEFKK